MSKHVDLEAGPLSDEDRAYLEERSRTDDILYNDRRFGEGGEGVAKPAEDKDDESVEISQEVYDAVVNLNEAELRTKLQHYGLPPVGSVKEMRTHLALYLQDREDESKREVLEQEAAQEKFKNDPTK